MEFTKKDLNKTIWIKQTDQEKNRRCAWNSDNYGRGK